MAKAPAATGLPAVAVRLAATGAYLMATPAIRVERRPREADNNFRKRVTRFAKKVGYAISAFENADGSAIPETQAPEADGGDAAKRLQVIFLHGRSPLGRALGPNGFSIERDAGEVEEAFRLRAMQAGAAKRLPWLAFEKPAIPATPAHEEAEAG